jgi:uncharacterized repeat protein (TIGR03803 family)
MTKTHLARIWDFCVKPRAGIIALTSVLTLVVIATVAAQAQTYTVLYKFTGGSDGYGPAAGLIMDPAGNLYGTTEYGGSADDGTVFQVKRMGSEWVLNSLYSFTNVRDGESPLARVTFGPDGSLYGTASYGGGRFGGTVFRLTPPSSFCGNVPCWWNISVLHSFSYGNGDGAYPATDLVFDSQGNIFGTTDMGGGGYEGGTVFELSPTRGGDWNETILHSFGRCDGAAPAGSLVFDASGNLYGTTSSGGDSCANGTVYKLTPTMDGWQETQIHRFPYPLGDQYGDSPLGGVILDRAGNLYGTTAYGGAGDAGTVFMATSGSGGWTLDLLHNFSRSRLRGLEGPVASLTMDAAGNLYGTDQFGGVYGWGSVFKMTRSGDAWTFTTLHSFTSGNDGRWPLGNVILDSQGNVYGTTYSGGECCGVVFEINQ